MIHAPGNRIIHITINESLNGLSKENPSLNGSAIQQFVVSCFSTPKRLVSGAVAMLHRSQMKCYFYCTRDASISLDPTD